MAIDTSVRRTRRALLAGGVGGAAALAATALGRPLPTRAGSDGDVVLGAGNEAATMTEIANTAQGVAFRGRSDSVYGVGVIGESDMGGGVRGNTESGTGVRGYSESGYGVHGESGTGVAIRADGGSFTALEAVSESGWGIYSRSSTGYALYAVSNATTPAAGVVGFSAKSTGVLGFSDPMMDDPPPPPTKTGVYGYAVVDANARGVHGETTSGRGVYGQATTGYGIRGYVTTGTAGYFATKVDGGFYPGYALRAVGRVKFDKCAGVATIKPGTKSVVVTPGIDLVSTSAVVATLQGNPGGTTTVQRVSVSTTANTFTVYLTANATADVKVAWIVIG